jgi:hypothetical protein
MPQNTQPLGATVISTRPTSFTWPIVNTRTPSLAVASPCPPSLRGESNFSSFNRPLASIKPNPDKPAETGQSQRTDRLCCVVNSRDCGVLAAPLIILLGHIMGRFRWVARSTCLSQAVLGPINTLPQAQEGFGAGSSSVDSPNTHLSSPEPQQKISRPELRKQDSAPPAGNHCERLRRVLPGQGCFCQIEPCTLTWQNTSDLLPPLAATQSSSHEFKSCVLRWREISLESHRAELGGSP